MISAKRTFYMLFGFLFPFIWAYHAAGFVGYLYRPIQIIAGTESKIWPSFITTLIFYAMVIFLIEKTSRPQKREFTPEWHTLHQQQPSGRESFSQDHCTEKGQDQPHHQESSNGQEESSQETDL